MRCRRSWTRAFAGAASGDRPLCRPASPPASRALEDELPPGVPAAAWELISGPLASDPWRLGKPLQGPYEGLHTTRRGTYRVIYKIDEGKHTIEIRTIRHRADPYRT